MRNVEPNSITPEESDNKVEKLVEQLVPIDPELESHKRYLTTKETNEFHGDPDHPFIEELVRRLKGFPRHKKRNDVHFKENGKDYILTWDDIAKISRVRRPVIVPEIRAIADALEISKKPDELRENDHDSFIMRGIEFINDREELRRLQKPIRKKLNEKTEVSTTVPDPASPSPVPPKPIITIDETSPLTKEQKEIVGRVLQWMENWKNNHIQRYPFKKPPQINTIVRDAARKVLGLGPNHLNALLNTSKLADESIYKSAKTNLDDYEQRNKDRGRGGSGLSA